MRLSKKTVLITSLAFASILVLLYWGIRLSLPPIKQGPTILTGRDILGEPSEEYKPVLAKIKKREPLTAEEQRIKEEQNIRDLEKFDSRAADYAREMLEQGYLAEDDFDYLLQKQKEFGQWVADELLRLSVHKQSGDTTTTLE